MSSRCLFIVALSLIATSVSKAGPDETIQNVRGAGVITNSIVGRAPGIDRNDPSDRMVPARMIDASRVLPHGPMNFSETPEAQALRLGVPCSTVVYRNACVSGCFVFPFGGTAPQNNVVDDLTIPPAETNRFICAAQAVTSTYLPFGGPPSYNLRQQLWTECPDSPTAVLLGDGDFEAIPNDGLDHVTTITIDPPFFADVDVPVYQLLMSDHPAADIVIANDTSDPGDIGTTANFFYIRGTSCAPYGLISPYAGFYMILYGGTGSPGSCCDFGSGGCTDGVLQSACNSYLTQSWSPSPCSSVNCVACSPVCDIGQADNLENEPDCYTNYTDTANRGCNNLTAKAFTNYFTPLTCSQSGCGRTGTYTFLNQNYINGSPAFVTENRRDADHYALDLTQDTRVTWTVNGKFPAQALIAFTLQQTNNVSGSLACPEYRIENWDGTTPAYSNFAGRYNAHTATSASACQDAVATAILAGRNDPGEAGPFRYMLIARPSVTKLGNTATCGLPYTVNMNCEPVAAQPTGACCSRNGCVEVSALACLLLNDGTHASNPYYQGDGTTCASNGGICNGVPVNDKCVNAIVLTCTSCVIPYDTTFAHQEGELIGQGGLIYRDVWFDYQSQAYGGCTSGRLVVSTLYNCYNTEVTLIRYSSCALTQAQKCDTSGSNIIFFGYELPIVLEAGPPVVNIGPWTYNKGATSRPPGECYKIRVGGLTDADFGPGTLRIDYVCSAPTGLGWDPSAGRCCFWDAASHTGNCMIAPITHVATGPACCASMGGYLRNTTDYYEGSTSHPTFGAQNTSEIQGMGCATWPCPAEGEACYNAWDLTSLLSGSGGFGTITRATRNRIYFKYQVPAGTPVGSGIIIDACGTDSQSVNFDAAMAVYRGFNLTSGECHQLDTTTGGPGNQACTNTPYNNLELARVNDCGPGDILSAGAQPEIGIPRASCFAPGETSPCLCLTIVAGSIPSPGQIPLGAPVWIGMGIRNTLSGSPRPFTDPVRSDSCGADAIFSIHVGSAPSCFSCSVTCPIGAAAENEPDCSLNYVDHTNAGCSAATVPDQHFLPIVCGQTYCGTSGTYRINKSCTANSDCGYGSDSCNTGNCQGPYDNTLDYDFYRIQLTQAQRLTWTVNAAFPVSLQILESPDDHCSTATSLATATNLAACLSTSVAADACPGYVYFSVVPAVTSGVGCGKLYYATLTCDVPSVASACCKGDMNNDGLVDGRDIPLWLSQALPIPDGQPATGLNRITGCFDVATCRADLSGDYFVDLSDLPGFVSALLNPNSCGPTACGDSSACHLPVADDVGVISDLNTTQFGGGMRVVDDFKVTSPGANQPLTRLCWYGFYFNFNQLAACPNPLGDAGDDFRITIYTDASGLPGNPVTGALAVTPLNLVRKNTAQSLNYLSHTVTRIKYEADLPAGITVSSGACYWLEIVNKTFGSCLWLWETSATSGNGVSIQQAGGFPAGTSNFYSYNLAAQDQSFCLPGLRIDAADCGLPLGKCCLYNQAPGQPWLIGTCSIQTRPVCQVVLSSPAYPAVWIQGGDCSTACPQFPGNDNCTDAILITSGPVYTGSIIHATVDGPTFSCEASCGSLCNTAGDVWYRWVSKPTQSQTTFTMCDPLDGQFGGPGDQVNYPRSLFTYDAIMAVYNGCPSDGGTQVPGCCNDDGCGLSAATVSKIVTASGVTPNHTYWIRISGWSGNRGDFTLRVNQP